MEDVIIVDNSPVSYILDRDNAIPIKTWSDDANDIELFKYLPLMEHMGTVSDVRSVIRRVVKEQTVDFERVESMLQSGKPPQPAAPPSGRKGAQLSVPQTMRKMHHSFCGSDRHNTPTASHARVRSSVQVIRGPFGNSHIERTSQYVEAYRKSTHSSRRQQKSRVQTKEREVNTS